MSTTQKMLNDKFAEIATAVYDRARKGLIKNEQRNKTIAELTKKVNSSMKDFLETVYAEMKESVAKEVGETAPTMDKELTEREKNVSQAEESLVQREQSITDMETDLQSRIDAFNAAEAESTKEKEPQHE